MPFSSVLVLLGMPVLLIALVFYLFIWPGMRIRRFERRPFPPAWLSLLQQAVPVYDKLPASQQQQLRNLIKRFLAEKKFIGCGGQEITDEIRVTIAANACLLQLNRPTDCYPQLRTILVYPSTFVVNREERDEIGLVSNHNSALVGESWSDGKIVLAWDDVQRGVRDFHDGHNVVLHEFAHELDNEDGVTNGVPLLHTKGAYKSWASVFAAEFSELQKQIENSQVSLFDEYGATNEAEFFAVATETFFEKPREMQQHHGELYQQLMGFYRVNPAQWVAEDD